MRSISVISVISVGLCYTSSRKITKTTKDYENSRKERKSLLLLRGAFPLFLLFPWDFIILKQVEIFLSHGNNGNNRNGAHSSFFIPPSGGSQGAYSSFIIGNFYFSLFIFPFSLIIPRRGIIGGLSFISYLYSLLSPPRGITGGPHSHSMVAGGFDEMS